MSNSLDMPKMMNYADALKEALKMRRNRTIDVATDVQLGRMCSNIAMWAMVDAYNLGKITNRMFWSHDFRADVVLSVVAKIDSLDLGKSPKEIVVYLHKVGETSINDKLKFMHRKKRTGELVEIMDADIKTDFYSNIIHDKEIQP